MESNGKNNEKKDGVCLITYKLVKKGTVDVDNQNVRPEKVPACESNEWEESDDDLPLMQCKARGAELAVVQPKRPAHNKKKQDLDVKVKVENQANTVKAKATYCKVCFIKTSSEEEADTHEASHNTFRGPDKRWTCIICQHQFSFYCDLLNHFLNHRDILELYSVYLSNLDTSIDGKGRECSDNESEDLDNGENFEGMGLEEPENYDSLEVKVEDKQADEVVKEGGEEIKNADKGHVELDGVVLKKEPSDVYEDSYLPNVYDNVDASELLQQVGDVLKAETGDVLLKKEILDHEGIVEAYGDTFYHDGFNDSDEDKPLSMCVVKKVKKKKKVKKRKKDGEGGKSKKKKRMETDLETDVCLMNGEDAENIEAVTAYREKEKKPCGKVYQCEECDFVTTRSIELENHSIEHVEGEPVLCELCDFRCKVERQLVRHKRLTHEGFKYACDLCEFTSKTIGNLKGHMVVHGERNIGCNICGKMFRRKNNLNDHLKTHTDARPFKCHKCPKTFRDPKGYKMHLLTKHNIVQRLNCSYCGFETDSRHELNMHKATLNHSPYMKLTQSKNERGKLVNTIEYHCNVCDYIASTKANLKSHLIVHDEKRISCEVCGKLFRRLGNLQEHQRSHSDIRPFACPVCPNKSYKDNKSYRRHIARHHGMLEMIKCDTCDYKTHTQGLMKIHMMKHSGQLRYKCNECSYACMSRNTMRRHKLVHKDVLPVYNCDMCDFQSVSDRAVKRHKQIHAEK